MSGAAGLTEEHRLECLLGYRFRQPELLQQALRHPSYVDSSSHAASYERLEFLGDAVLDLLLSCLLWEQLPQASEGQLSAMRAQQVCQASLLRIAGQWDLQQSILVGRSLVQAHSQLPPGILADVVEALIGAVFLDGGWQTALAVFRPWLEQALLRQDGPNDSKSALQEWCHKHQLASPTYQLLACIGPDHAKTFVYQLNVGAMQFGPHRGASKRKAEQACAQQAMLRFTAQNKVELTQALTKPPSAHAAKDAPTWLAKETTI